MPWYGDVHVLIRGPWMKYTCDAPGEELTNWGKLVDLLATMVSKGFADVGVAAYRNDRIYWRRLYKFNHATGKWHFKREEER